MNFIGHKMFKKMTVDLLPEQESKQNGIVDAYESSLNYFQTT